MYNSFTSRKNKSCIVESKNTVEPPIVDSSASTKDQSPVAHFHSIYNLCIQDTSKLRTDFVSP
jgi:hypothetical protein